MSETLPLNEWPLKHLIDMYELLSLARFHGTKSERDSAYDLMLIVKQAIKDAEQKLEELPFK